MAYERDEQKQRIFIFAFMKFLLAFYMSYIYDFGTTNKIL